MTSPSVFRSASELDFGPLFCACTYMTSTLSCHTPPPTHTHTHTHTHTQIYLYAEETAICSSGYGCKLYKIKYEET